MRPSAAKRSNDFRADGGSESSAMGCPPFVMTALTKARHQPYQVPRGAAEAATGSAAGPADAGPADAGPAVATGAETPPGSLSTWSIWIRSGFARHSGFASRRASTVVP